MSNSQQREELHRTIWSIADELRGAIGGWLTSSVRTSIKPD